MKKVFHLMSLSFLIFSCSEKEDALSFEDQLAADIAIIDEYLSDNEIVADIHDSGISYVEHQVGDGNSPTIADAVTITYKGMLLDGTVFDQNSSGVQFPLQNLISSWQIMIPEMKEGGELTMYAPSVYCYGSQGIGIIPPNSILVFDVKLLKVN